MDLALDESQTMFERTARDFFRREWTASHHLELASGPAEFSATMWKQIGALGWLHPATPAHAGAGVVELQLLAEAMGETLFVSPLIESIVMTGWLLATQGTASQRQSLLEPIVNGDIVATVALYDVGGWLSMGEADEAREERSAGATNWLHVTGTRALVRFARSARFVLWPACVGDDPECTLLLIDLDAPGVECVPQSNIADQPLYTVSLHDVPVAPHALLGTRGRGAAPLRHALTRASTVQCGEIAGAARRVQDLTIAYARQRHQFGRPIGSFQLVQSLCVDIAADTHRIGLLGRQAAWLIDSGEPHEREAAIAAAFAAGAIARVVRNAHEVHAGMGFMSDYNLHSFTRLAKHWETRFGDVGHHLQRVAELLATERR